MHNLAATNDKIVVLTATGGGRVGPGESGRQATETGDAAAGAVKTSPASSADIRGFFDRIALHKAAVYSLFSKHALTSLFYPHDFAVRPLCNIHVPRFLIVNTGGHV